MTALVLLYSDDFEIAFGDFGVERQNLGGDLDLATDFSRESPSPREGVPARKEHGAIKYPKALPMSGAIFEWLISKD